MDTGNQPLFSPGSDSPSPVHSSAVKAADEARKLDHASKATPRKPRLGSVVRVVSRASFFSFCLNRLLCRLRSVCLQWPKRGLQRFLRCSPCFRSWLRCALPDAFVCSCNWICRLEAWENPPSGLKKTQPVGVECVPAMPCVARLHRSSWARGSVRKTRWFFLGRRS